MLIHPSHLYIYDYVQMWNPLGIVGVITGFNFLVLFLMSIIAPLNISDGMLALLFCTKIVFFGVSQEGVLGPVRCCLKHLYCHGILSWKPGIKTLHFVSEKSL